MAQHLSRLQAPCTKLKTQQQRARQLVELVECYISPSLACTCPSFCPHAGPVRCLYAHMSALKIDLGTRACDFPITSWHVPCENIRFWLHLRQRERG